MLNIEIERRSAVGLPSCHPGIQPVKDRSMHRAGKLEDRDGAFEGTKSRRSMWTVGCRVAPDRADSGDGLEAFKSESEALSRCGYTV